MSHSTLPDGQASELGFDADRLAAIGPAMQAYIDAGKVPNLATMVVRHGQVVHLDSRGQMDLEGDRPIDHQTLFRMYSNTKPIAGVATMILYEAGVLTPDDPVTRARIEAIEEDGGNAFADLQLPDAVTALKQGAGRLIRDVSDRGVLVIGDVRIRRRGYGRTFLNSLPPMPVTDQLADVRNFFSAGT